MRKLIDLDKDIKIRLEDFKKVKSMGRKDCTEIHLNYLSSDKERMFYLGSTFQPVGRLKVLDTGWYCDNTLRGLILALPHGRFLAGWTLGESMISFVEKNVFRSLKAAERHADDLAEEESDRWLCLEEEGAIRQRILDEERQAQEIEEMKTDKGAWQIRQIFLEYSA